MQKWGPAACSTRAHISVEASAAVRHRPRFSSKLEVMALNVEGSSSSSDAVVVSFHVRVTSLVSASEANFIPPNMDFAALLNTRGAWAAGSRSTSWLFVCVAFVKFSYLMSSMSLIKAASRPSARAKDSPDVYSASTSETATIEMSRRDEIVSNDKRPEATTVLPTSFALPSSQVSGMQLSS